MVKNRNLIIPKYSKRGLLIEHTKYNKNYWKFLIFRVTGFILDFAIPGTIQFLLWQIFRQNIFVSGLASLIYYHIYYFLIIFILQGRTIGMYIFRQRIVHNSGFLTSTTNYYFRAFVMSIYSLPFIGWFFMSMNLISMLLLRGWTLFDLISFTIVVSENQYQSLLKIEKEGKNV